MRLGHGHGGGTGLAIDEKLMAIWALSFATCGEVVHNVISFTNPEKNLTHRHKEELLDRIKADQMDLQRLQCYLKRIIEPMDPASYPGGQLLNIVSGQMAIETANPHEALSKGQELIKSFKNSWPAGFRASLTRPIVLMDVKKRCIKIGDHRVYDQSFIFARTCGLMMNNPNIKMEDCLVTGMAPNPPVYFDDEGNMRSCNASTC